MKPFKVVHLSSVHPPDDPRIAIKECGALSEAGYDVVLVSPEWPAPHAPVAGRTTRLVPRARTRLERMTRTVWNVLRVSLRERPSVYHFHDAELILIAPILRLAGGVVIYDAHEHLPDSVEARYWVPRPVRRLITVAARALEWFASRLVHGIVAATPRIGEHFPARKTVVVQNFSQADELRVPLETPYEARAPLFVYIGAIADVRGAREMVRALERLDPAHGARLVLAGPYSEQPLIDEISGYPGWARIERHPWQSRAQVAGHLDRARAGLVLLHPTASYLHAYPVKLFEYLSVGLPVIASDFPLWREILAGTDCALFVDPRDPAAIAAAMQWILDHPAAAREMGARGRALVERRFSWQVEATKLVTMYRHLLPQAAFEADPHPRNA